MRTCLFINRVYPPTAGATGEMLRELAEGLVAKGWRVVVVTGAISGRSRRERLQGVEVVRAWGGSWQRGTYVQRAWRYAVLYPQLAWLTARIGKVDTVVTMTDPPMQMVLQSWFGSRRTRKIHWAQDVYPDVAEKLGVITAGGWFARRLGTLANSTLRHQDHIVALGRCMRDVFVKRGVAPEKIEIISNWSSIRQAPPQEIEEMRMRLGWNDDFIVLYSGNFGLAHDFNTVAKAIRDDMFGAAREGRKVRFVFAGEGPRLEALHNMISHVEFVNFLPRQDRKNLGSFLGAADAHLVTVREELSGLVVPSKAYGALAVGRPILYVGEEGGEVARLLKESGAGVVIPNGDSEGLAHQVMRLARDREAMELIESNVQKLSKKISFEAALEKWEEFLLRNETS